MQKEAGKAVDNYSGNVLISPKSRSKISDLEALQEIEALENRLLSAVREIGKLLIEKETLQNAINTGTKIENK